MNMRDWFDGTQLDLTSLNISQEQVVLSPPMPKVTTTSFENIPEGRFSEDQPS